MQLDDFKSTQRSVWDAGDYGALSPLISDVGERVVSCAQIESGMKVLDVACGTGNAARPAARAGAHVAAIDFVPRLLAEGKAKAAAEGLDIDWREGDVEDLPFEDRSFDRVLSTFGHMFGPRHRQTANEMERVCRRGGAIVIATWAPEGSVGELLQATAPYMPPPPGDASPPILWGREDYIRELFTPAATRFEFEHHVNTIVWESLDGWAEFFMNRFPPMVTAKRMLGDRFAEMRERVVQVWADANQAKDGSLRLPQEYLVSIVHL